MKLQLTRSEVNFLAENIKYDLQNRHRSLFESTQGKNILKFDNFRFLESYIRALTEAETWAQRKARMEADPEYQRRKREEAQEAAQKRAEARRLAKEGPKPTSSVEFVKPEAPAPAPLGTATVTPVNPGQKATGTVEFTKTKAAPAPASTPAPATTQQTTTIPQTPKDMQVSSFIQWVIGLFRGFRDKLVTAGNNLNHAWVKTFMQKDKSEYTGYLNGFKTASGKNKITAGWNLTKFVLNQLADMMKGFLGTMGVHGQMIIVVFTGIKNAISVGFSSLRLVADSPLFKPTAMMLRAIFSSVSGFLNKLFGNINASGQTGDKEKIIAAVTNGTNSMGIFMSIANKIAGMVGNKNLEQKAKDTEEKVAQAKKEIPAPTAQQPQPAGTPGAA